MLTPVLPLRFKRAVKKTAQSPLGKVLRAKLEKFKNGVRTEKTVTQKRGKNQK